jgi:hypothetical protein
VEPNALHSTFSSTKWRSIHIVTANIPGGFATDCPTVKANSQNIASVSNALPSTLSSANWISICNTISSIATGFFTD